MFCPFFFTSSGLKYIFFYNSSFMQQPLIITCVTISLTIRISKSKKEYLILFTQSVLVRGVLKKA